MTDEAVARLERVMEVGFRTLADLQRETNARLDGAINRLDTHERVLIRLVDGVDAISERLDTHEQVLIRLVGGMDALNQRFDHFLTGTHRAEHEELRARVDRIEKKLGMGGG